MSFTFTDYEGDTVAIKFDETLERLERLARGIPVFEQVRAEVRECFEQARSSLEAYSDGVGPESETRKDKLEQLLEMISDVFVLGIRDPSELMDLAIRTQRSDSELALAQGLR